MTSEPVNLPPQAREQVEPAPEASDPPSAPALDAQQEPAERRAAEMEHLAALARTEARAERAATLSWVGILILLPLGLLGLSAPFGTTILGVVAISHIRNSAGMLYGMGLAVFDALVFPLLLFDSLFVHLCTSLSLTGMFGVFVSTLPALLLDVVIFVLVWRVLRVRTGRGGDTAAPAAA